MTSVLFIDDELDLVSDFEAVFQDASYTTISARNGEEGLSAFESQKPDIVVTDILMPGKDGLELITAIRKQAPDVPIIAITAGYRSTRKKAAHGDKLLMIAREFGADSMLVKPFDWSDLLDKIAALKPSWNEPKPHLYVV